MTAWLDELGYRLCWSLSASRWRRTADAWCWLWYRYRCPYPTQKDHSAKACVRAGLCGCDNGPRINPRSDRKKFYDALYKAHDQAVKKDHSS